MSNLETEKLREDFNDLLTRGNRYALTPVDFLKVCKKAGLKFVGDFDGCDWFDEHDMTHGCSVWDYCPSLKSIKEIEI